MNPNKPYITVAERKNLCKLNDLLKQFNKGVDTTGKTIDRILAAENKNLKSPEVKVARNQTVGRLVLQMEKLTKIRNLLDIYDKHNLLHDQYSIIARKVKDQFEIFIQVGKITIDLSSDELSEV